MVIEIRYYQSSSYEQPFVEWLRRLSDRQARTRIEARLARIAVGNLGDVEDIKRAKAYFEDYKARSAKKSRGA